jgi:hypothetical protein
MIKDNLDADKLWRPRAAMAKTGEEEASYDHSAPVWCILDGAAGSPTD